MQKRKINYIKKLEKKLNTCQNDKILRRLEQEKKTETYKHNVYLKHYMQENTCL